MSRRGNVDVYPVGILSDLLTVGRALNPGWLRRRPWPSWLPRHPDAGAEWIPDRPWRRQAVRAALSRTRRRARDRRAWRGYYAEAPGVSRVGTGWTQRRALADLDRARAEDGSRP